MIKYIKIHKKQNIHHNNQLQYHLMDKFIQTFLLFVIQRKLLLLYVFNGMTSVFDILIKISLFSLFTLILVTLPNILDGIDFNLAKTSEFERNSGDDNDGIGITSNIYQSKGAPVGVGFFLATIYSIRQVIVGVSLIIAVSIGIAAFSVLIARLQLNLNVESSVGVIYCDSGVIQESCYFFCNVFSFLSVFFQFVNVVFMIKYDKIYNQRNIHHNNYLQYHLMNKLIQILAILVLFNEIHQRLLYLQLFGPEACRRATTEMNITDGHAVSTAIRYDAQYLCRNMIANLATKGDIYCASRCACESGVSISAEMLTSNIYCNELSLWSNVTLNRINNLFCGRCQSIENIVADNINNLYHCC